MLLIKIKQDLLSDGENIPDSIALFYEIIRDLLKEVPLLAILTRNISSNFFP